MLEHSNQNLVNMFVFFSDWLASSNGFQPQNQRVTAQNATRFCAHVHAMFFDSQENQKTNVQKDRNRKNHPATTIGFLGVKVGLRNVSNFFHLPDNSAMFFLDAGALGIQLSQVGMQSHCIDGTSGSYQWRHMMRPNISE